MWYTSSLLFEVWWILFCLGGALNIVFVMKSWSYSMYCALSNWHAASIFQTKYISSDTNLLLVFYRFRKAVIKLGKAHIIAESKIISPLACYPYHGKSEFFYEYIPGKCTHIINHTNTHIFVCALWSHLYNKNSNFTQIILVRCVHDAADLNKNDLYITQSYVTLNRILFWMLSVNSKLTWM